MSNRATNAYFTNNLWSKNASGALVVDPTQLPVINPGDFVPIFMDKNTGNLLVNTGSGGGGGSLSNYALEAGGNLASINTSISLIEAGTPNSLGQAAMASSMPVVIASNQSAIPVTGTFFQATQPISSTQIPASLGQTTMSASLPVTIASNQSAIPISASVLPLPTGSVASTQIPASLGQAAMAASLSVAIASNQSSIAVTPGALVAGSAIIGKVGIDQTTVGTTNAISLAYIGTTAPVTAGVNGVLSVGGNISAGTTPTANPLRLAGLAFTAAPTARATGTLVDLQMTTTGAAAVKPYSVDSLDWQYSTAIASPITNTTAVAVKAAGAAGIRNYVTGLSYVNTSATASIITIQDGSTVIWTGYMGASMTGTVSVTFPTPLRGTAATAMNFVVNTTATNTFISTQGYQAP